MKDVSQKKNKEKEGLDLVSDEHVRIVQTKAKRPVTIIDGLSTSIKGVSEKTDRERMIVTFLGKCTCPSCENDAETEKRTGKERRRRTLY